ncbi:MAG: hypothetical protein IKE42_15335 [Aquamicrobium sp.]|nr:hypothetical protein [Aquamicrobium sp.]
MSQSNILFRVHLSNGTKADLDAQSSVAARTATQKKLAAEGSKALITKIKVLKSGRS